MIQTNASETIFRPDAVIAIVTINGVLAVIAEITVISINAI